MTLGIAHIDAALGASQARLAACDTSAACWRTMRALFEHEGIPHVSYGGLFAPHSHAAMSHETVYQSHFDPGFMTHYAERGHLEHDVVVHWAFTQTRPRSWSSLREEMARTEAQRRVWDEAAMFGVRNGMSIPLRFGREGNPGGLFLSATRMKDREWQILAQERHALLVGLANTFHETMTRFPLFGERLNPIDRVIQLSRRERQSLLWASRGCLTGEIATHLGVADRTVEHHLASARRKLQARTTAQAVARAMAMGQLYGQA